MFDLWKREWTGWDMLVTEILQLIFSKDCSISSEISTPVKPSNFPNAVLFCPSHCGRIIVVLSWYNSGKIEYYSFSISSQVNDALFRCQMELDIAYLAKALNNTSVAKRFTRAVDARKRAFEAILWNENKSQWLDYWLPLQKPVKGVKVLSFVWSKNSS